MNGRQRLKIWCFLTLCMILFDSNHWTYAQIATDGTVGLPGKSLNPVDDNYSIGPELGEIGGNNLFHSFQEFNLKSGESATFTGPETIANILSRVTGGNPSSIDGIIRSEIVGANFFFMNPAGVMFGPNAQLDVSGSFFVTTADSIEFGDGQSFDATEPGAPPLMVSAPPVAFGFLSNNAGNLTLRGSILEVKDNHSLSILGGEIRVENQEVNISAGRANLISVGEEPGKRIFGSVDDVIEFEGAAIESSGKLTLSEGLKISFTDGSTTLINSFNIGGQDLTLSNVIIESNDGTNIDIDLTGSLTLTDGTQIFTITESINEGGNITIKTKGSLEIKDRSQILTASFNDGPGGNTLFEAGEITMEDSDIRTFALGGGKGGDVMIKATEGILINTVTMTENATITTETREEGQGGNIVIETNQMNMDNSDLLSSTNGDGKGGNITIKPSQSTSINAFTMTENAIIKTETTDGHGGNIMIETGQLRIMDANVQTNNEGGEKGGNITFEANTSPTSSSSSSIPSNSVVIEGKDAFIQTQTNSVGGKFSGDGGSININTEELSLLNEGRVITVARGTNSGKVGDISVGTAEVPLDSMRVDGKHNSLVAKKTVLSAETSGSGQGGDVSIYSKSLEVLNSGQILTKSNFGSSETPGKLELVVDKLRLDHGGGSGRDPTLVGTPAGEGSGNLNIKTTTLEILNGAQINSNSVLGLGGNIDINTTMLDVNAGIITANARSRDGGNIVIKSRDTIQINNSGRVTALAVENGGNIELDSPGRITVTNSEVTANAGNNGGNISMNANEVILDASQITARAQIVSGGNIRISARAFISSSDTVIDVSVADKFGVSGNVEIFSPDIDIAGSLAVLPESFTSRALALQESCAVKLPGDFSSFIVVGKGGIPIEPGGIMPTSGGANN